MKEAQIMKIFIFGIVLHYILSGNVTVLDKETKYDNPIYRNFFSIPNTSMAISANGGEFNKLYLAFDDDQPDKGWISVGTQGADYKNLDTKIEYESLTNHLLFTFEKTSLIDRMIYRTTHIQLSCPILGYPKTLKVYYRLKNDEGHFDEDENDFVLADDIISEPTNKTVLFTFKKTIKCDQLKLEWNQTSYCDNYYKNPLHIAIVYQFSFIVLI